MNKNLAGLLLGLAFVLSTSIAQATIITFDYVATGNGGTVTGTFGYDDTVADTVLAQTTSGKFPSAGFFNGSVSGGPQAGYMFDKVSVEVLTWNDHTDNISPPYTYIEGFAINDGTSTFVEFFYSTSITIPPLPPLDSDALTSSVLPSALSNLAAWPTIPVDSAQIIVYDGEVQLFYVLRDVTQVPEPSILVLLGFGLAGIGFARRRKLN